MMDVLDRINSFDSQRRAILADVNLSDQGRRAALAAIEAEANNYHGEALRQLRIQWGAWKSEARRNVEALKVSNDKAARAWDYERLNYNAQAIAAKIAQAKNFSEIAQAYQGAKDSGDLHALRSWIETGGAQVLRRFGNDPDAQQWAKGLDPAALDTPEQVQIKAEGQKLTQRGAELNAATQRARAYYHPNAGGIYDLPDDFTQLTQGVTIETRVDAETLTEQTTVTIAD